MSSFLRINSFVFVAKVTLSLSVLIEELCFVEGMCCLAETSVARMVKDANMTIGKSSKSQSPANVGSNRMEPNNIRIILPIINGTVFSLTFLVVVNLGSLFIVNYIRIFGI